MGSTARAVPDLLVVSESLYIYALTKRDMQRQLRQWACVVELHRRQDETKQDGGAGLRAGASLADEPEQLVGGVLRDVWRIVPAWASGLWSSA